MKRSEILLCGALAAFCASGSYTASAEVADHVTIYGQAHVSVDYSDNGSDDSFYASSNSSYIGMKGKENLADQLNVVWAVDSAVNLDESGSTFASRNAYAGISQDEIGTVLVGRHDTPFKIVGRKFDMFTERVGDSRNVIGAVGAGWDLRPNNVIAYKTPEVSGLHGLFAYVPEEGVDKADAISGYLMFKEGPALLALGGERHGRAITGNSEEAEIGFRALGSYTVEGITGSAIYERVQDAGGVKDSNSNAWGVGLSYQVEQLVFKAQYTGTDGLSKVDDSDASLLAFGVEHKCTENTTMYLAYATSLNGEAASYASTGGGHGDRVAPVAAGEDTYSVSVGLINKF